MEPVNIPAIIKKNTYPLDLIIVIILSLVSAISIILLPGGNLIRIIFALPIVIFFPGYAFVSFLWPENHTVYEAENSKGNETNTRGIKVIERIVLSFGLSIVILAFIGIILNFISEISLKPILAFLIIFIVFVCGMGWYRRSLIPEADRFTMPVEKINIFQNAEEPEDKFIAIVLVISLIISGFTLAYVLTNPLEGENFTEFYVLDQNRGITDLPLNMTTNETKTITIGTVCHEYESTNYIIIISLLNTTGQRQNITLSSYDIALEHEQINETFFAFQIDYAGQYKLTMELYKDDDPTVYREIHLWIDVNVA